MPPGLIAQTWPGGSGSLPMLFSLCSSGVTTNFSTPSSPMM